jgi:hypothetical protein
MDFRKSDPYVKFRFCGITKKSSVKRGELNPTWNEEKDKCSFIFKIADLSAEMPVPPRLSAFLCTIRIGLGVLRFEPPQ